jgi:cob(I)alamin adenosyltransferase
MTKDGQSAILEILERIQADGSATTAHLAAIESRLDRMEGRIDHLETRAKKQNSDSAAMLVMMRAVVRDFNDRVTDIEDDVRLIKRRT